MATRERIGKGKGKGAGAGAAKRAAKRANKLADVKKIGDWVPILPFYALRSCAEVLVQLVHLLHATHRNRCLAREISGADAELAAAALHVRNNLGISTDLAADTTTDKYNKLKKCCEVRHTADKYSDIVVADVGMFVANGLLPENLEDMPDEYMKYLDDHRTAYIEILDNDEACVALYDSKCAVIYQDSGDHWAVLCKYTELLQNCLRAELNCRPPPTLHTMDYAAAIKITDELRSMGARGLVDFGASDLPCAGAVGFYTQMYSHTLGLLAAIDKMAE